MYPRNSLLDSNIDGLTEVGVEIENNLSETNIWYEIADLLSESHIEENCAGLDHVTFRKSKSCFATNQRSSKKSMYVGVSWYKRTGKWAAQINFRGTRKHLGYYSSEIAAATAYNNASSNFSAGFENQ